MTSYERNSLNKIHTIYYRKLDNINTEAAKKDFGKSTSRAELMTSGLLHTTDVYSEPTTLAPLFPYD